MGISRKEFWAVVDKYVNKKLFEKDSFGKWKPKFQVGVNKQVNKLQACHSGRIRMYR